MCGVMGFFSANNEQALSAKELELATATLKHRGPDGQQEWLSPKGHVGLGHTRLSIIDLETGSQPLSNETGDLHLVANGELYGFEEIRAGLIEKGHKFRTKSDSEIILHLYEDYGTDCLRFLRGEFAFILWDDRNQLLFAARDRFGIKPLYYGRKGDTWLMGSEIKALLKAGLPAEWDQEIVYQMFFSHMPAHRTLFRHIFQVQPGHFVVATRNQFRETPYWDFNYPLASASEEKTFDEQEVIAQLRAEIDEAIRLRLRADVEVGVYLSGGLDSSSILGMASKHTGKPIQAFTLMFDQEDYDEGVFAKETAQFTGAQLTTIPVREQDLADNYVEALYKSEYIPFNTHGVAKFMLSRAVREAGFKVVLTGEGSDEIFAGYPNFRKDYVLFQRDGRSEADPAALLQELRDSNKVSLGFLLSAEGHTDHPFTKQTLGFTPSFLEAHWALGLKARRFFGTDFLNGIGTRDPICFLLDGIDIHRQMRGREAVHQSLYLWSKTALPNYLLNLLGDRMEMAHSVEGRVPFLDHKVVEMVTQLPVRFKIKGMNEKYILKEAAKPYLTDTLYRRQKHPFLAPPAAARDRGPLTSLMQDTLRSQAFKALPFFDQKQVVELLDSLPAMSMSERSLYDPILMQAMGTCLLQKVFAIS